MQRDLVKNLDTKLTVVPQVVAADVSGVAVDTRGADSAIAVVQSGAIVGAGLVLPVLQESDTTTDGDFTDVAAGDIKGTPFVNMAASSIYKVGYTGKKRYLRIKMDYVSGTSIAASAAIVLGTQARLPVGGIA